MERYVISLERHNLPELHVVERLAATLGAEAFEVEVQRLASLHTIDFGAPVQSIARFTHPSLIGMSDAPFDVLSRVCDQLVIREPALLERPSYRCRHSHGTALPLALWLDLVRFAREEFDPAKWDAEFLVQKQRSGLSIREAFTPRIAQGRLAVKLHLLSPAHRPVQVTQDLANFWRSTYAEVRKDLKGRYPKHYWPDDPLVAEATARAKPRK